MIITKIKLYIYMISSSEQTIITDENIKSLVNT